MLGKLEMVPSDTKLPRKTRDNIVGYKVASQNLGYRHRVQSYPLVKLGIMSSGTKLLEKLGMMSLDADLCRSIGVCTKDISSPLKGLAVINELRYD